MRLLFAPFLATLGIFGITSSCTSRYDDTTPTPATGPDTIFPMSYFPAWPGSDWTYVDTVASDTVTFFTDPAWYTDSYFIVYPAQYNVQSSTYYTPRFTDNISFHNTPIWGYQAHSAPIGNAGSNPMHRLVSDSLPVGSHWTENAWSSNYVDRKIIAVNQTVVIGAVSYSPTIVIEDYNSLMPPYQWRVRRYYTKDIGIVREEIYNSTDSSTTTYNLIGYHINH